MKMETCRHCARQGTGKTVEWNPVDAWWQCRDVAGCARRSAETKLEGGLHRALRREK